MKFRYVSNYTGEVYRDLNHALRTIISDIVHYPKCRTIKMFWISRLEE